MNYLLEESLGGICFCFEAMDFAEEMPKMLFVFVHCFKGHSVRKGLTLYRCLAMFV